MCARLDAREQFGTIVCILLEGGKLLLSIREMDKSYRQRLAMLYWCQIDFRWLLRMHLSFPLVWLELRSSWNIMLFTKRLTGSFSHPPETDFLIILLQRYRQHSSFPLSSMNAARELGFFKATFAIIYLKGSETTASWRIRKTRPGWILCTRRVILDWQDSRESTNISSCMSPSIARQTRSRRDHFSSQSKRHDPWYF